MTIIANSRHLLTILLALVTWAVATPFSRAVADARPILVGLDADMSSSSARSGEAIRRGAILAIDEINHAGGVLGRPLKLVVRDHRGNPARGRDNIGELAAMPDLIAVVGGIHTPVALHELEVIHKVGVIYLGAWAAGTPVVDNGFMPNHVFRVSVRDALAGPFLVSAAKRAGHLRLGLLLERTGWGRSNEKAMTKAIASQGLRNVGVEWFNWGVNDLTAAIGRLRASGADALLLVANPAEGILAVKNLAALPKSARIPIVSHWGITGGDFFRSVGPDNLAKVDLTFLQTYSFQRPTRPARAAVVTKAYFRRFNDAKTAEDIFSPVGTAHAYDIVHLLARAITKAGLLNRADVRDALERLGPYAGLVRDYAPPFTPLRHDALDASDFTMARFDAKGRIMPVEP